MGALAELVTIVSFISLCSRSKCRSAENFITPMQILPGELRLLPTPHNVNVKTCIANQ